MLTGEGFLERDVRLKEECRDLLARPRGEVKPDLQPDDLCGASMIISVGDRVTLTLLELSTQPHVAVIDLREKREFIGMPRDLSQYRVIETSNPAGIITARAWRDVKEAIERATEGERVVVLVEGEEDLLGFPAVICAPDCAIVLYGQPGQGIVVIHVDEGRRRDATSLLMRCFDPVEG